MKAMSYYAGEEPDWWLHIRHYMRIAIFYSNGSAWGVSYHHDFLLQRPSNIERHGDLRTHYKGDKDTVVVSSVRVER